MLHLNNKLTIFIPTFNRQYMLEEIVRYHSTTGAYIVVADASAAAWKIPADLVNKVDYRHAPGQTQLERLQTVLPDVNTPFFVFRSDRRHQTNRGHFQCVQYLEANPEYASATGVWLRENNLRPYHPLELITRNGEIECPYARLRASLLTYQPPYYNVQRTCHVVQLAKAWNVIEKHTTNLYYHEYVQCFFTLLVGKMKQLDCLAGILQNAHREDDYTHTGRKTVFLLQDSALSQVLADILYTYLPCDIQDRQCFDYAIAGAISDALQTCNLVSREDHFTKIFTLLNSDGKMNDSLYLDNSLRMFVGAAIEQEFSYDNVRQLFTHADLEEQKRVLEMIGICHKKFMLRSIKEVRAKLPR